VGTDARTHFRVFNPATLGETPAPAVDHVEWSARAFAIFA
jgi:hypothetical protein